MFVLCVTTTISPVHFKTLAGAKVAGNGKSPEGEGEGGFLGQIIWMGRYWWTLEIYK